MLEDLCAAYVLEAQKLHPLKYTKVPPAKAIRRQAKKERSQTYPEDQSNHNFHDVNFPLHNMNFRTYMTQQAITCWFQFQPHTHHSREPPPWNHSWGPKNPKEIQGGKKPNQNALMLKRSNPLVSSKSVKFSPGPKGHAWARFHDASLQWQIYALSGVHAWLYRSIETGLHPEIHHRMNLHHIGILALSMTRKWQHTIVDIKLSRKWQHTV